MKILVVDDSPVIRSKLEEVLVDAGYSVATASDGMQGLDMIHKKQYDLLFLDIDMPNLSGYQVCRMLRNEDKFKNFPIIMLTARDQKKDQYWGIETGATAYMTKPFNQEVLLGKVAEILNEKNAGPVDANEEAGNVIQLPVDDEDQDVLFEAGELQEMQLFKMSLVNKIYQIATSQLDLEGACGRIADIFSSVIDFELATFLITDEEHVLLHVFVKKPVSRKFFMETRKTMLQDYREKSGAPDMQWDNIDVNIHDPENNMLKDGGSEKIEGMHTILLESTGEKFGLFTMARGNDGNFSDDEIFMSGVIAGQSSLVINNVRMYEKIKRFAVADGLTGLHNHRYFQEQLEIEYSRARRFNLSLSMIMLDLDNFKMINDTYGHQQGDIILKGLASIMRRCVRDIDLVARYGGEEFAVILPETPKKNAMVVAERIREALEQHEFFHGNELLEVRASLGVSGHPDDDIMTKLDLIAKADTALYKAKNEGRNRVCLYTPERSNF